MTKQGTKISSLFSIWKIGSEINKTWSLYQSLGLQTYLYGSSFNCDLKQGYALTTKPNKFTELPASLTLSHSKDRDESCNKKGYTEPLNFLPLLSVLSSKSMISEEDSKLRWSSFPLKEPNKDFKYYVFQSCDIKEAIEKSQDSISSEKCFNFSRDYSFIEEPYESWSFIEKRPYDSLVRENLLEVFDSLEKPVSVNNVENVLSSTKSIPDKGSMINWFGKSHANRRTKYAPIEEQLVSDDIQQVYASRLHFQQKIKWFYGLPTTSSLNRHIFPYNTNRGVRSKKLMGFSFLSELEKRLDVQLYKLGWFPTIASSKQGIKHKHIRVWTQWDRSLKGLRLGSLVSKADNVKSTDLKMDLTSKTGLRNVALNYKLSKGDLVFFHSNKQLKELSEYWLKSNQKLNHLYTFPWYVYSQQSWLSDRSGSLLQNQSEKVNVREDSNKKVENRFSRVWLLGNQKGRLGLSSLVSEQIVECIKPNLEIAELNSSDLIKTGGIFNIDKDMKNLRFLKSPIWNNLSLNHLEYHCQSFFVLYKRHPSWIEAKLPETKDRAQNLKNYISSHI